MQLRLKAPTTSVSGLQTEIYQLLFFWEGSYKTLFPTESDTTGPCGTGIL
uniref:Uncharacterized protein n=1 Tax=Anguilla anguilla TaxID=7936 RepID=A0A0E9WUS1_ANGAN